MAFLTMIRVSTGENWDLMKYEILEEKSLLNDCIEDFDYKDYIGNDFVTLGCGVYMAKYYFFTFNLIVSIVFLNLFVAIILQGFDE